MDKKKLRSKLKKIRELSNETKNLYERKIISNLSQLLDNIAFQSIAFYYPKNEEINLIPYAKILNSHSKKILLPRINNKDLEFYCWNLKDKLALNEQYNLYEPLVNGNPLQPDIIICPLLGFWNGYRLGYGSGYYDRTLNKLNKNHHFIAIGIGLEQQNMPIPIQEHDYKMQFIVTEQNTYKYNSP